MYRIMHPMFLLISFLLMGSMYAQTVKVEGELKRWHKVTVCLTGPTSSEQNSNNPFLNFRYNVTFSHPVTGTTYTVPGYFAADGNAGNTGATSGNKWKAHLSPDHTGNWNYSISFRQGNNVAIGGTNAGSALAPYNGVSGSFNIAESDKTGRDFRAKTNGRLEYVGKRYLKFAGSNKYFIKQGPDAPENLLNYKDFDGMFNNSRLKSWSAHLGDWKSGDPTWKNGKGKALIGAVNYLASEGLNAFSFLTMNVGGDDNNAYPYVITNNKTGKVPGASKSAYLNTLRTVMDCSKLEQWEVLFAHATSKGMYLHFKTQETENDQYLDGGNLGTERKLYYRELIARFSHHLALNWNLGEETTNTTSQLQSFAKYFHDNDPYQHNVVLHTFPSQKEQRYNPLLGNQSELTGLSLQTSNSSFGQEHGDVLKWVKESQNAGKPWVVAVDEPGDASAALRPDNNAGSSHENGRKRALWGTFMAGGAGNEWYFGYKYDHSDLTCQDFRSRDKFWDYARYSLQFFNNYNVPFVSMSNQNALIGNGSNDNDDGYCLAKTGSHYVIYLPNGGSKNLNLNGVSGSYTVKWYDPRNGGSLQNGSVTSIDGNGNRSIGNPPNNTGKDWVAYVVNELAAETYLEEAGLLIMEMENTSSDLDKWVKKTSIGGYTDSGYLEFTGNKLTSGPPVSPLEFNFKIEKAGLYHLHLHCARETAVINGETRTDVANDAFVRVEGDYSAGPNPGNNHKDDAPLSTLKSDTKFFGGDHNKFVWASGNRLDLGGHNNKRVAIYNFKAGETYKMVVHGRSKLFKVNRILFRHEDVSKNVAQNINLPESERGLVSTDPDPDLGLAFNATSDFPNTSAGEVPYYADNSNNALAIDASNSAYHNKYARAERTFNGDTGTYSVKIVTLTEIDGESTYRLHVNGSIVKTYKNPYIGPGSSKDMGANTHTWEGVSLKKGDTIAISSNTHTNGEIPEGNGTAWARGRWRSIEFMAEDNTPDPEPGIAVTKLNLINAATDQIVKSLTNGTVINKVSLSSFSVQAITSGEIGSVIFELNGSLEQTENKAPYSVSGDTKGKYNDWPLTTGNYTLKATPFSGSNGSGTAGQSITVKFSVVLNSLPSGKTASDVGNTGSNMLVAHDNGTYLISASGTDIWGKADSFGFVHQDASGDVELTAKIESIENTNTWAKAGVMIRESLDAGSMHAMTVITPEQGASFQRRTATDANSSHTTFKGIKAPEFVRVLRMGDQFTGYYSTDSQVWFPMNSVNISMYQDVKVGLAVTSHDNSQETEAIISNFTVRNPGGNFAVTRFILVNADTNEDIREIHHNETININTDGISLSIRAEATGVEGSVVIDLDGIQQTENVAPYALLGDANGDYDAWSPAVGTYTIIATPYAEAKGNGAAGDSLAIVVNVVND